MHMRSDRTLLLACTFILVAPVLAGPLDKAFQALEVRNYFLAREVFLKQARKHPVPSWYGLSVISGRNDNPFFQPDSAYAFIQRSDAAFAVASERQMATALKYGVDNEAITAQRHHVHALAWELVKAQHTIAAYDRYINTYFSSPFVADATLVRDHLAFQEAREANTAAAYQSFLGKYPRAREVYEARTRMQEAMYREATADKDIASYTAFIRAHPESPWVRQAEEEVYRLGTPHRTAEEYRRFIAAHPENHKVPDAWRAIYELYTRDLSVGTITRFLQDHPEYPFVEELVDDYKTASMNLLPFRRGGLWGFIDEDGVERVKAEYEWVEHFEGGQALVGRDGRVGTINRQGRVVTPIEFDDVLDAVEGTSTVRRMDRAGAVDRNGDMVVPMRFDDVGDFSKGLAYASRDGRYGYIDARGTEVVPFRYTSAGTFHNGLAVVQEDGYYGVIDTRGNVVVPARYDWVEGFAQSVSRVRLKGLMGLISPFGDELMPVEYQHIGSFVDGLALVIRDGKVGYADEGGRFAIALQYEAAEGVAGWGDFRKGLARVQQGGKRCLINARNEKVIPCQYSDIGAPGDGLVPVRKRGKWGYARRDGSLLFDNRYDQAYEMNGGLARVRNNGLMGAIDSTGKEVVPLRYLNLQEVGHDMYIATVDGPEGKRTGLVDHQGREVVDLAFDDVTLENTDLARVERAGRIGYIRLKDGRFIWREEGFGDEASAE